MENKIVITPEIVKSATDYIPLMKKQEMAETKRHNVAMENKPTGPADKKEKKTVTVFVGNKKVQFPTDLIEELIARSIRDGVAGNIQQTIKDITGTTTVNEAVTATTKLTDEQKMQIFQKVYPLYLYTDESGNVLMRKGLSAYDKRTQITAQDKMWKKPKQAPQTSTGSLY